MIIASLTSACLKIRISSAYRMLTYVAEGAFAIPCIDFLIIWFSPSLIRTNKRGDMGSPVSVLSWILSLSRHCRLLGFISWQSWAKCLLVIAIFHRNLLSARFPIGNSKPPYHISFRSPTLINNHWISFSYYDELSHRPLQHSPKYFSLLWIPVW